eukprot:CAMPEP_0184861368 /NCGR_PEP_ID=MMETSP0580-20130426/6069_1 /TAXON_ID=1118495 /ORGANISM="Dactyliosolen fragilissimus" /LENGTH=767 /DNA_ID=CAMNT_0027358841 /DNA_START=87 /DNA_END=2391 /DNA_ORIENTATION=-
MLRPTITSLSPRRITSPHIIVEDNHIKSHSETNSGSQSDVCGDYQVLQLQVKTQRNLVRRAHAELASSLLRLGEHHVRVKEYDQAIKSFKEALDQRRHSYEGLKCTQGDDEEILDEGEDKEDSFQVAELHKLIDLDTHEGQRDSDEIISTLNHLGNIHSTIGNNAEAMKYYTEIMTIRASNSDESAFSIPRSSSIQEKSVGNVQKARVRVDNSTNEDIKALDELFQSISFRKGKNVAKDSVKDDNPEEKIKVKKNIERGEISSPRFSPITTKDDDELKQRESRDEELEMYLGEDDEIPDIGIEIKDALDAYRKALDSYNGQHIESHRKEYDEILTEVHNKTKVNQNREKSLYLTLSIYDRVLSTQRDDKYLFKASETSVENTHGEDNHNESEETMKLNFEQASITIASTYITMGGIYYKLSNVNEELNMYNEALQIYEKALGEDHPYVAGTRKNIGMVLAERSDLDAAMEQFEKAKDIYSANNNGSDMSRDVASALSCMGNVENRQGNFDNALSFYSKALHIFRTLAEKSRWTSTSIQDVTSTLKIIGMVYSQSLDLDSAMKCFQEAMELLRSSDKPGSSGNNSLAVASILTRMGGIFFKRDKLKEAMDNYQEAFSVISESIGTTMHPDVAGIYHYMGTIHQKRNQFNEAMACFKESMRIYTSTLGPGNPSIATTLVCMGSLHYKKCNFDRAMYFYKEALRLYENSYGSNHPEVAPTLKSIAMIHTKKGEYNEALDIFTEILGKKSAALGPCHPEVATAHKSKDMFI